MRPGCWSAGKKVWESQALQADQVINERVPANKETWQLAGQWSKAVGVNQEWQRQLVSIEATIPFFFSSPGPLFHFCTLVHEFLWNGLQQLRLFSVSPHNVGFSGWYRLTFHLNPGALLFGYLFLMTVLLHPLLRKLSLLFKCLMCSICTLILMA